MTHRYSKSATSSPFRSFIHKRDSFANERGGNEGQVNDIGANVQTLLDVHKLTSVPQQEGVISAFRNFAHEMELKTVNG